MPRITEFFLVDTPEQYALTLQADVSASELPIFIERSLIALEKYFKNEGLTASDCPFLRISGHNQDKPDIMIGLPLAKPTLGRDSVRDYAIPAGKTLFCYHRGDNSHIDLCAKKCEILHTAWDIKTAKKFLNIT